jgi:hypothetical protein
MLLFKFPMNLQLLKMYCISVFAASDSCEEESPGLPPLGEELNSLKEEDEDNEVRIVCCASVLN